MGILDFFKKKKESINLEDGLDSKLIIETKCDEIIEGIPFGFKNSWFVFKSSEYNLIKEGIAKYLKYDKTVDFQDGISLGFDGYYALLKPIGEFTILINSDGYKFLESARELSKVFGEVTYYNTHRSNNTIVLVKYINGVCLRDFIVSSDNGVYRNIGIPSDIEIKIAEREKTNSLNNSNVKDNIELYNHINSQELLSFLGEEENLMEIAENWTINPSKLDQYKVNNCIEIYK